MTADPRPLPRAYAHSDCEHPRPLLDALHHGFCNVEADVYLVDGRLLIAHDEEDLRPGRSLEALYLEPLRRRVLANGGRVHRGATGFTLLIDVKTEAEPTYLVLSALLTGYREILTAFGGDGVRPGAVTVLVSGNRPVELMAREESRLAALDGRLPDLEWNPSPRLVPWVSDEWSRVSAWRGVGPLPTEDAARLRSAAQTAHRQGRKLRFWGAPDLPSVWRALLRGGVDLLSVDDLSGLRDFLLSVEPEPSSG